MSKLKNVSHFVKWVTLKKMCYSGKMSHTWKNVSQLEK